MPWPTPAELDDLVARFRSATLPKPEWTHAAHQAVGALYVHSLGPVEALAALRAAIRRLNDFHGTANTETSGYHETITRAYTILLARFLEHAGAPLAASVQALLASPLAARDVLFRFYSREALMAPFARAQWVEPDLRPLDWPLGRDPGREGAPPGGARGAGGATTTRRARPRT